MTRDELTGEILAKKRAKGLSWKAVVAETAAARRFI
jgi:cyanate lyase